MNRLSVILSILFPSTWRVLVAGLLLVLISTSMAVASHDMPPQTIKEPQAISLQLKWKHQFQFAGYYAAKFKGFYAEEGLDVTIKPRDLFKNNIQQVLDGESQYGIADSMLLLYQAKGAPLAIVAPIFQHSPQVLMTLESSGLDSLFKLEGRNVMFYQKDTDGFPLLSMLHHNSVDVDLNRFMAKPGPQILLDKKVDAYPGYLSNEPYFFKQIGIDINIIHPMHYGIDLYGDLIFTHQAEIEHHPERVAAFKRASLKGWAYALQHPEEVIDYLIDELQVQRSRDHLRYEARVIADAIQANSIPLGQLNEGRLQYIQNLFINHGLIETTFDLSEGIYRPQKTLLNFTPQELRWMKLNPDIKVAIDVNWPPFEFVNEEGEYDGIAKDYFDYLHQQTGLNFIPSTDLSWSQAVNKMKSRELDMYGAVMKTPERQTYTKYTKPYIQFPMVIATQKGENYIPDLNKLQNKTVAAVKDYAAHELISEHYPHLDILTVNDIDEGLRAVSQGQAYGYVDNLAVIGYHIKKQGMTNIQISGETPFDAGISMAVRSDWPELHSILSKVFAAMDAETQAVINNPWLQVEYKTQIEWKKIVYALLPVGIVMLIVLFYNRKLRNLNRALQTSNQTLIQTQQDLRTTNKKLELLSVTDFLTGAYNRQYLDQSLDKELNRAERYQTRFSVLLIDLDNFKTINDRYGHLVGDEVLKETYRALTDQTRKSDMIGRWGGEEFLVICPSTDLPQALELAQKILHHIEQLEFHEKFTQTASIGVAAYQPGDNNASLIERADQRLYQAKSQGKNQACAGL